MKLSIPALKGPVGCLVVAPAEKASLLGSQFDSNQCCEQFVTPLSCFHLSKCNSLHLSFCVCFLILTQDLLLDLPGGVDPFCVFPLFIKMVADIIAPKLSMIFWDRFRSVG